MQYTQKVLLLAAISETVNKSDLSFLEPKLFTIQRGYISLKHPEIIYNSLLQLCLFVYLFIL